MSGDTNRPMAGCDNDRLRSEGVAREAGAVQPAPATVPRSRQRAPAGPRRREAQSERRGQRVSIPSEPIGRPDTAAGRAGRSTRHRRPGVPTRRARHTRVRAPNRYGRGLVLRRRSPPRSPQERTRKRATGPWSGTGEASRFKRTGRLPTCQSSANQWTSRSPRKRACLAGSRTCKLRRRACRPGGRRRFYFGLRPRLSGPRGHRRKHPAVLRCAVLAGAADRGRPVCDLGRYTESSGLLRRAGIRHVALSCKGIDYARPRIEAVPAATDLAAV